MAVRMVEEALRGVFRAGWDVRSQLPIALDPDSEPEPDVSVVPGSFRDYPTGHPTSPVLVVEIADTSLALDRGEKAGLYAHAGIQEYWIVDLVGARPERFIVFCDDLSFEEGEPGYKAIQRPELRPAATTRRCWCCRGPRRSPPSPPRMPSWRSRTWCPE